MEKSRSPHSSPQRLSRVCICLHDRLVFHAPAPNPRILIAKAQHDHENLTGSIILIAGMKTECVAQAALAVL